MSPAAAVALVLAPALALGSFANVLASRVPLRQSIAFPGSHCMSCDHELAWYDNIPLASYLLLRGRCRYCGAKIGVRYFLVELACALLAVACVLRFDGFTADALIGAAFCIVLVVISAVDIEHRIVPNRIVLPAAALALVAREATDPSIEWPLAALGAAGFLFIVLLAYPSGMGMGDVKLALLLGAVLGRTVGVGMFIGVTVALIPSIVLFARHGMSARKQAIPFAPWLALGAITALFAGDWLLDQYLDFAF